MMTKEAKKIYVEEMKQNFTANESVMIAQYQGLNVTELDELRKELREKGIIFKITKNRITKLALEKTKCKDLSNLFNGPTAVAFGEDDQNINQDRVINCLEKVGLLDFFMRNTDKLNMLIGENGLKLSGGQLQKLNIARALYLKPKILILDEVTNNLDIKSQEELLKLLNDVCDELENRTKFSMTFFAIDT